MAVTAEEAGSALNVVAEKLHGVGILSADGRQVLSSEGLRVKKARKGRSWTIAIARDRPITFERVTDRSGIELAITVSAKGITVDQIDDELPPFSALDMAVELNTPGGEAIARWHIDRASEGQPGPLYHLQFGGHSPGQAEPDALLKEPRWCHPPIELALLCEVVAANFFERIWKEQLRDDPSWCRAIQVSQKLCYTAYMRRINGCLNASQSTALNQMWNGDWR